MICSCLSTVVYAPSRSMASATSRTVLGPRDHITWRIASSAPVGVLRSFMVPSCTMTFVDVNTNVIVGRLIIPLPESRLEFIGLYSNSTWRPVDRLGSCRHTIVTGLMFSLLAALIAVLPGAFTLWRGREIVGLGGATPVS